MTWVFFTIIAIVFWAIVNIMDKYIIGHELRDPILVTTVFGITLYLLFVLLAVFNGGIMIPPIYIGMSMLMGLIYSVAISLYYISMQKVEVSELAPILATEPMVIALAAFFLFAERLTAYNYFGIVIIILGALLISHEKSTNKSKIKKYNWIVVGAMLLFATRNLMLEHVTSRVDFWPMIFWFGIGGVIIPIVLLIFHHPHIRKKAKEGVAHLFFVAFFSGLAMISFTKAIALGSVSLSAALLSTKPMLVFLAATFLSFFHPKIIVEKHTKKVLIKKAFAIVLIVVGGILVIV